MGFGCDGSAGLGSDKIRSRGYQSFCADDRRQDPKNSLVVTKTPRRERLGVG